LVDGLKVAGECWAWFDGDDRAVVLPDVVEETGEELVQELQWQDVAADVLEAACRPRATTRPN